MLKKTSRPNQISTGTTALLPFYVPVITVTAILAALFWFGMREQDRLRSDHIERVLASLSQSELDVASDIRSKLEHAEKSLARYQDSLLRTLRTADTLQMDEQQRRFADLSAALPDGTVRSRRTGFDGRRDAGIWLPRGLQPEARLQARMALAKTLTEQFGQGAEGHIFADTWWLPAEGGIVIFGPSPDLAEFVFQAEADFSYADTDWMRLTRPEHNPGAKLRWTPMTFDPTPKVWMFSAVLPVLLDGQWLGSVGHDVPLAHLLRQVESLSQVEGSSFVLLGADNKVIASDRYASAIIERAGGLTLAELDEPLFAQAAKTARAAVPASAGADQRLLQGGKVAFVSHIAAQDWLLINVVPLAPITGPVQDSFRRLRDLASAALLLELIIATGALWWNHRQSRRNFAALSAVHADLVGQQQEILGKNVEIETKNAALAAAYQSMHTAYRELDQIHGTLLNTQKQLLLQEKMASLGTLTAGVAHEINNPTNFIHVGNQNLLAELKKFREFVAQLLSDDADPAIAQAFATRFDQIEEQSQLIDNGSRRIQGIVRDLRSFSRMDTEAKKPVDLNQLLTATLNLVRTEYKDSVVFNLELQDLPLVSGWSSQLAQVFMNLMVNACQAIEERQKNAPQAWRGRLSLRSRCVGANAQIEFDDNGGGMTDEVCAHLFEPFFTTKAEGVGTGLGLSISWTIIKKHEGAIDVNTVPGTGSVFTVCLPLRAADGG